MGDNFKTDLREMGYDDRDWINLAQDWDLWRAYVRAAMNLRIPISNEALRNIRHHAVRSMLAEALKEVGFTVHQEVQGLATQGSVRRIDIIAIKNNSAYILDPTIRFETHADQPHEVDSEKKRIYEPTIPFYKNKYSLLH
ncbi:hypothetical protein ANN_08272 [Periplaneta americana]|uniref:Uncharacterized protein n=1 Tax=Periplaneta americana TaxID=6978 RepID=A0ABQ8T238_PERAM|nr:hypothetical protein ANN_08272 [Periplaneta americana]